MFINQLSKPRFSLDVRSSYSSSHIDSLFLMVSMIATMLFQTVYSTGDDDLPAARRSHTAYAQVCADECLMSQIRAGIRDVYTLREIRVRCLVVRRGSHSVVCRQCAARVARSRQTMLTK